ncbi:MAG: ATP-binding protein [Actinomycetota bacterium]|nr:ATP-binding protein [Actinomycetota bacterium]
MQLALDLSLPAESRLLAAARAVLAVCLREFGAPAGVVDDVILATDEACTNVLRHAYPEGRANNYVLRADLQQERIQIEVVDEGVGFDLMAKPPPRDDDGHLAPSGRGFEVMCRLMTSVEIESPTPTGGTRLRLVRLLPPVGE